MATESHKRPSQQTHIVTPGSTIRIETPASSRQHKPNMATLVVQEFNPAVGGFVNFLREYSVVGLAVGFVIGLQAQTLVKQLVDSFIKPLFELLFGKALSDRSFTLHFHGHVGDFHWGAFAYGFLSFLFVLAAIYGIVKGFKIDKIEKPDAEKVTRGEEK